MNDNTAAPKHRGVPKDATEVTEEQAEQQDQHEHRNDDPDAPGRHQDRRQIADET
ncbi:MAG: hypothetical protein U5N53_11420 [Mycobacterium sp.]|nr:hypothetical protein [Mycobacterium sp.]